MPFEDRSPARRNSSPLSTMPYENYYMEEWKEVIDREFTFILAEFSTAQSAGADQERKVVAPHDCSVQPGEPWSELSRADTVVVNKRLHRYMTEKRLAFLTVALSKIKGPMTYQSVVDSVIAHYKEPPQTFYRGFIHVLRRGGKSPSWLQRIFGNFRSYTCLEVYWLEPDRGELIPEEMVATYVAKWDPLRPNFTVLKFPVRPYRTSEFWRGLLWRLLGCNWDKTDKWAYTLVSTELKDSLQLPDAAVEVDPDEWKEMIKSNRISLYHEPFDYPHM